MPANPWKRADREQPCGNKEASTSQGYPPLTSQGPSKAQRRVRALYSQSATTFEPYPPRIEHLNRQELTRRLLNDQTRDHVIDLDHQPIQPQRNGISSITIYNEDGERLSKGPDIYRRSKPIKPSYDKVKHILATSQRDSIGDSTLVAQMPLPSPFTDKKLDNLMQECGRHERLRAIEDRSSIEGNGDRETADNPLKQELLKAFSSLNGFLAAFGKEHNE